MGTHSCTDKGNPLASPGTFDQTIVKCAEQTLQDYPLDSLRTCTFGEEAAALRKASNAKTDVGLVWVNVAGKSILAPEGTTVSRKEWADQVSREICSAYTGASPSSCPTSDVS